MNELKVYQNEIILTDFKSKEKTYSECKVKTINLTEMHRTILEKDKQFKTLKNNLNERKSKVNDECKFKNFI